MRRFCASGTGTRRCSPNHLRPGHIERMVDQRCHPFDESYRMRQGGVNTRTLPRFSSASECRTSRDLGSNERRECSGSQLPRGKDAQQQPKPPRQHSHCPPRRENGANMNNSIGYLRQLSSSDAVTRVTCPMSPTAACDLDVFCSPAFSSSKLNCLPTAS